LANGFGDVHRHEGLLTGTHAGFGEGEQLLDEARHLAHFILQVADDFTLAGFGAMFENSETELHARDGRAQFMRDVAEEAFLPVDEAAQASCHSIDASGQEAKLIAPVFREAIVEVSFRDALGDAIETRNGARESANEGKPAHYEDGDDGA